MTHTQIIIGIIVIAGFLGGLTNFFLLYNLNYKSKECWVNFFKSILLSLCASITVPLFLQIIQTNLLEIQSDTTFPDKNYFVLFGFCVLAAVYSKRFLGDLYDRLNKAEKKVEEVKEISEESDKKVEEAKDEVKRVQTTQEKEKSKLDVYIKYLEETLEKSNSIKHNNDITNVVEPKVIQQGNIDKEHTMLAVATGKSFDDNIKYNIYYDPALRRHSTDFKFIGLYKDWAIRAIGEVKKIVYCDYDTETGGLFATKDKEIFDSLTTDELMKITNVIRGTQYYDLTEGQKFFLIDKFYETEYTLDSPIMGKQYFWLNEFSEFNKNMSAEDVAKILSQLNKID